MEVRLWHEFARYVSLIAADTTEGRSLFAPAFLCEHSRNEENGWYGVSTGSGSDRVATYP